MANRQAFRAERRHPTLVGAVVGVKTGGWAVKLGRIVLALSLLLPRPMSMAALSGGGDRALRDVIVAQQGLAAGEDTDLSAALRAIVTGMQMAAGFDRIVIPISGQDTNQDAAIVLQVDHSLLPGAVALGFPVLSGPSRFLSFHTSLCGSLPEPESPPPRFSPAV